MIQTSDCRVWYMDQKILIVILEGWWEKEIYDKKKRCELVVWSQKHCPIIYNILYDNKERQWKEKTPHSSICWKRGKC